MFKRSAHLEKEDCVILADGELNKGGVLLVTRVLHVDADDLLAACLHNFLLVIDVPVNGVHVVGVDHRQHRIAVRLDILEDLGERHGERGREQCDGRRRSLRGNQARGVGNLKGSGSNLCPAHVRLLQPARGGGRGVDRGCARWGSW